jgi:hypothetical protein
VGALTEAAPGSDTASSGLNGRLQRIAQRISSLITALGSPFQAGGSIGNTTFAATQATATNLKAEVVGTGTFAVQAAVADGASVTFGAKADAKSTATDTTAITAMSVWKQVSASVQAIAASVAGSLTVGTHAVTQSGTWTVQPGNTANSTAWLVTGTGGTFPVTAAALPLPSGAATEATLGTLKAALSVAAIQATASGDTTLIASGTRKLKRIEASNSHATVANTVGLKVPSLNGGAVFGKKYLPAAGGTAVWVFPNGFLQATAEVVSVNLSAGSATVEVTAYYE